jgi:serine/threonine protein kinase
LKRSSLNFDGLVPQLDTLWYGETTFELLGENYIIDSFLNYGAEGQTYMISQVSTGKKFVAKFCIKPDAREVILLQQLPRQLVQHPNFLSYELIILAARSHFAPAHSVIIMEHVPNGELFEMLASQEPSIADWPVSEGTSRRFLHDIINGMAECYRFGITHRDLKPENLLINEQGNIVIIDLGHAKRGEPLKRLDSSPSENPLPPAMPPFTRTSTVNQYGSAAFNAPEVSSGVKYDCERSDVWSVGVIAFILHGKLPAFTSGGGVASHDDVEGPNNESFWRKINSCGYYPAFPNRLVQFINALWKSDPTSRPLFSQLEQAIKGDQAIISKYGLQWLAEPVNDESEFISELRCSCPGKVFKTSK